MTRPRMLSVAFAAVAVLLLAPQPGEAKRMNPAASAAAMDQCYLSGDAQFGDNQYMWGCCSREAGICVICYKPPSATGQDSCNVVAYKSNGLKGTNSLTKGEMGSKYKK